VLGTITPLGERARQSRWGVTALFYMLGSLLSGALLGGIAGTIGSTWSTIVTDDFALGIIAVIATLGLALDTGIIAVSLPTTRRQVNDTMLPKYRGWVYGAVFGLQLGTGVLTIVRSSVIYVVFVTAMLAGNSTVGAAIGASFGALRASSLLLAASADDWNAVARLSRRLDVWRARAWIVGRIGVAVCVAACLTILVR
jgi:sulfite exporter TauE/SafE